MKTTYIDLSIKKSFPIGQQYDHKANQIVFINLDYEGDLYINVRLEGYENFLPLVNNTFIVGLPLTANFGQVKAQLYSKKSDSDEYVELSKIFYMYIEESMDALDPGMPYPTDPNIEMLYDDLMGLRNDINILESRMNQFTSLQEGSTTGDAELIDGRIGYDGTVYDNIGDAIREQVGELNSDLVNNTNCTRLIPTQKDRYINTSGSTVDVTNFIGGSSAVGFNCYVITCEDGDLFTINGNGGVNAPRLWAFVDENGNNLLHSGKSDIERDFVIIAPKNSKWLVINDNSGLASYRGEYLTKRLDTVEKDINNGTITKYVFYTKLGYYKGNGSYVDNAEFVATDKIRLPENSISYISGSAFVNGTNTAIATYFDFENNIIGTYCGDSVSGDHTYNFTNVKIPQGTKYVAFSNSATNGHKIYLTSSLLNESTKKTYYVGYGQYDGDIYFDKLADCLKVAEAYNGKKTINIQSGNYDVYNEFGGYEYFSKLDYTEYTWSTILPTLDNVEIIGHGNVVLNFYPDSTLNGNLRWLLSCLNVRGDVYIENITINCGWCRYGIHDESDTFYPNTTHIYKNVNINMNTGDYISATGGVAFGNGYSKNSKVIMEDCNIVKGNASEVWSCHANQDCILTFKGCIFDGNGSVSRVRISQNGDVSLYAKFENCFIENGIAIRNEGNAIVDGNTQIDLFNTKVDTIENGYSVNRKPITSYNTITGDKTVLVIPTE